MISVRTTPGRRRLAFHHLDEVSAEADRLLDGHTTLGRWTLGQIGSHLTTAVLVAVDPVPGKLPWVLRRTAGRLIRAQMLWSGRMPEGAWLPREFQPRPGTDARAEVDALKAAIRRFLDHPGPLAEHPMLGPMTRDQWDRFLRIHCAHHLSFVVPTGG